MNPSLGEINDPEAAISVATEVEKFLIKIGLHKKLKDVNMPESEIPSLARQCMVLPDYKGNPKVATEDEMVDLVKDSYY